MAAESPSSAQFAWTRRVPSEWREQLAQFTPPSDRVPYLWLDWFAGESYERVQRWALWEIKPWAVVKSLIELELRASFPDRVSFTQEIWNALNGPNPRDLGHWGEVVRWTNHEPNTVKVWKTDALVTLDQYRIHKQTHGLPQLYWIIQGEKGGHRLRFTQREEMMLKTAGVRNPEPPLPGDLAYAPFDNRVLDQLAKRDRVRQWQGNFSRAWDSRYANQQGATELRGAEERLAKEEARADLLEWLKDQVEEVADELAFHIGYSDLPRRGHGTGDDPDEQERRFIEDI